MVPAVDPPLRRTLLTVLVALLVTATVCLVEPREQTAATPLSSVQPLVTPGPPAGGPAPTTAPSVHVPPLQSGAGCGLTLRPAGSVPATSAAAPVGHCTVVEIGDSLGNDLGWGLGREVSATSGLNLVQLDKSASGLAHPSFYDWPAQLPAAVQRYHPQLVVICLGGDDVQGQEVDGSAVQFGTKAWTNAYVARVHQLALEATRSGAFVLWVGMPVMRPTAYSQDMQSLNDDFQAGIAGMPTARFLSTRALFANAAGTFAPDGVVNGTSASLRESDGIHFSLVGENLIATYVLQQMAMLYDVRLAPAAPAVITGSG